MAMNILLKKRSQNPRQSRQFPGSALNREMSADKVLRESPQRTVMAWHGMVWYGIWQGDAANVRLAESIFLSPQIQSRSGLDGLSLLVDPTEWGGT